MDNERATAINPGEAVEEKVSLSRPLRPLARLPQVSRDEYLAMVFGYVDAFALAADPDQVRREGAGMGHHPRRPASGPHGVGK